MVELIHEKISVVTVFNQKTGSVMPYKIRWRDRDYIIVKLGYHHAIRQGRLLLHIFHVSDGTLDFSLCLNTENLHWTLEEVYDGTAD